MFGGEGEGVAPECFYGGKDEVDDGVASRLCDRIGIRDRVEEGLTVEFYSKRSEFFFFTVIVF